MVLAFLGCVFIAIKRAALQVLDVVIVGRGTSIVTTMSMRDSVMRLMVSTGT
jgi:hypothetical protein